ncbi:DUF262 domain-containing protein [Candidatus Thiodictyon syntrophicum]|jgi:hypothetical protein|uniref:GmrSD restriction endonucleases N-terminal domain-containing protein n=1 Tax=Candidatus Thiodictyon syntrophicum TaxID=1166950 RepID=A0A2K8U7G8_9GAMM|nr:DUF262 domain-containing protein [Candidatus Thiodictyon syntrophicum]AUB81487.1 hypothetical protein THSYN_11345 [Candidatus Thiodictyon syntrophicum]
MTQLSTDDGPEINPSVVFLFDLLKWVRQGRIRVPAFQRSYVWTRANMLDLFDSVRWRYPIGTLLFWKSSKETARPLFRFGPFDLSQTRPLETLLLLDGQQRLTTLAGVLLRDSGLPSWSGDDEDAERWNVYFDASGGQTDEKRQEDKSREGVFMHLASGATAQPWQVPLHQLSDTNKLFETIAPIFNAAPETLAAAGVGKEVLVNRLQGVARALQSYKIPIVEFMTDDLNLAVESFTRLNRKGVAIGADEMFSALTYQAGAQRGFRIASEIDSTLAEIKQTGFGKVNRVLVLRAFLVAADLDPYRTDWSKLGDETQKSVANKLPEAMRRAREGLLRGIELLREEHIHNARMLPYGLQLVGLSAWLGEDPSPTVEAKRLLRRWLWLTGFASWFGQGNPSRYAAVLAELRDRARMVREQGAPVPSELRYLPWDTRAEPFPERYDLRSARVRTLLCLLARRGVFNPDGTRKDARAIADDFARNGPEAMRTIWASSQSLLRSSPANRMFDVFGLERGQARTLFRRTELVHPQAFLESHWLPYPLDDALQKSDSMELVLKRRLEEMITLERQFMFELGIQLPASAQPGASIIDQDDDAPLPMPDAEDV